MKIEFICTSLIDFLIKNHYKETTINYFRSIITNFKSFCEQNQTDDYDSKITKQFILNACNSETEKKSKSVVLSYERVGRLLESFYKTGIFDLSYKKKRKREPTNPVLNREYKDFIKYIELRYDNPSSRKNALVSIYNFFQYLEDKRNVDLDFLSPEIILSYIKSVEPYQVKDRLRGIRLYFEYKKRQDLLLCIEKLHAKKRQRIIPMFSEEEKDRIYELIRNEKISARNSAIILLGLHTGIRACDVVRLKVSDINWDFETISFTQLKTGNPVSLPLPIDVGNAIARYFKFERPKIKCEYLFLSSKPPYKPLKGNAACYSILSHALHEANIEKGNRIFGMHMLRHNVASTMVQNGIPVETIAAVLGHSSPESTTVYIATDEERLRCCVLPLISFED